MLTAFCDNKKCPNHIEVEHHVLSEGLQVADRQTLSTKIIRRFPYRVEDGPNKMKLLWFCETCKAAIDMSEGY